MSFLSCQCKNCKHTFYRIEVRCGKIHPAGYICPMCNSENIIKKIVPPKKTQQTAEESPCCQETGACHLKCSSK